MIKNIDNATEPFFLIYQFNVLMLSLRAMKICIPGPKYLARTLQNPLSVIFYSRDDQFNFNSRGDLAWYSTSVTISSWRLIARRWIILRMNWPKYQLNCWWNGLMINWPDDPLDWWSIYLLMNCPDDHFTWSWIDVKNNLRDVISLIWQKNQFVWRSICVTINWQDNYFVQIAFLSGLPCRMCRLFSLILDMNRWFEECLFFVERCAIVNQRNIFIRNVCSLF